MVDASVVICTYRRPEALALTLAGVRRQVAESSQFEAIVVDNDPSSSASELVLSQAESWPNLMYVHEPLVGESLARNRGAQEAQGDWIIYLDDDAIPDQNWLRNLMSCIAKMPGLGVVGGAIMLSWPSQPPRWLTPDLFWALSFNNHQGDPAGFPLDFPKRMPYAANIAYARESLARAGGFDPRFGRQGDLQLSGAETELNYRLHAAGCPIWYCPRAIVHHQVPSSRLERAFFRTRSYWAGIDEARLFFEAYGRERLRKKIVSRIILDPVRFLGYGLVMRRNPFLTEIYFRELISYVVQAMRLLRQQNPEYHAES